MDFSPLTPSCNVEGGSFFLFGYSGFPRAACKDSGSLPVFLVLFLAFFYAVRGSLCLGNPQQPQAQYLFCCWDIGYCTVFLPLRKPPWSQVPLYCFSFPTGFCPSASLTVHFLPGYRVFNGSCPPLGAFFPHHGRHSSFHFFSQLSGTPPRHPSLSESF